jgi:hypothetical protein
MGSTTEANCGITASSWWPTFLINVGATDGFVVVNPMGDATEAIVGMTVLFVDPAASAIVFKATDYLFTFLTVMREARRRLTNM